MTNDQNNQGQNNNPTKEVHRDPSLPFITVAAPADIVDKRNTIHEQRTQTPTTQPTLPQSPAEPVPYSSPQTPSESADVESKIESIKAFLNSQITAPAKGLNDLFSMSQSSQSSENQAPILEAPHFNPKTRPGLVQQRSELKKAA